ncbi:unnamed protein product, partial [marine sediment metagenome]
TNDLLKIAGFNKPLLRKISPYITLRLKRIKRGAIRWKTIASNKYPLKEGYSGSSLKISNRIRYNDEHIAVGGATYKDA